MKNLFLIFSISLILLSCGDKPEVDFTWTPTNPKVGEEIQFTNLSTGATKYSWNLGDITISKEENPKHKYQRAGEFIIDLSASKGLKSAIKTKTIIITPN